MKLILWLLILGGIGYVAFKVVPVYFANYQLEDTMKEEARFAVENRRTPEQLREIIYKKAKNLEILLKPSDIRVDSNARGILIRADYSVPVDLQVYKFVLQFNPTSGIP